MTLLRQRLRSLRRDDRGSAVLEWPLASLLLLIPVAIMVILLPTWSEHQTVARDAATVAAREAVLASTPEEALAAGDDAAFRTVENFGLNAEEVSVTWAGDLSRGGSITATVTVRMPAIVVPGWGGVDAWSWSASHTERVDDYRSIG